MFGPKENGLTISEPYFTKFFWGSLEELSKANKCVFDNDDKIIFHHQSINCDCDAIMSLPPMIFIFMIINIQFL